ncbi:MAG: DNA-3-methyladenine glycosylase [Caulobacteraceae bacterium]|nr:DNA-3-methyladenine glycosylase [Caulobacteraceae bacterium]
MAGLSPAEIAAARLALAAADPLLARAHAAAPDFALRARDPGYAALARMVVEQQVSVASARAIWARLEAGLGGTVTAQAVLARDEETLRSFGLSGQKARYVRAIAEDQGVFAEVARLDDAAAVERLTRIKGVGRWTAELYLLFAEGRADFLPAGDVALREAVRRLEDAPERISEQALYDRAEAWRPHRGVAALMLWAYYGASKAK